MGLLSNEGAYERRELGKEKGGIHMLIDKIYPSSLVYFPRESEIIADIPLLASVTRF